MSEVVDVQRVVSPPKKRRGKWSGHLVVTYKRNGITTFPLDYGPCDAWGLVGWRGRSEAKLNEQLDRAELALWASHE